MFWVHINWMVLSFPCEKFVCDTKSYFSIAK